MELDAQSVPKSNPVFRKLFLKEQNESPWDMTPIRYVEMDNPLSNYPRSYEVTFTYDFKTDLESISTLTTTTI